jgi:hypothetical protein
MRKMLLAASVLALLGTSSAFARGSHGGGPHQGRSRISALLAPANPSVPPSLTSDPRLTGSAPLPPHQQPTKASTASISGIALKPDPEDAALDRKIRSICRGC